MKNQSILTLLLSSILFTLAGCGGGGDSALSYITQGFQPEKSNTVLVLPFLDARSFKDEKDPDFERGPEMARKIFLDAMRASPAFSNKTLIAPTMTRSEYSLALSELDSYGHKYHADLVVAIQLFSYIETRAASIPPRAGCFVRFYSVPEERVVFACDEYLASGAPQGKGGRDIEMNRVAQSILTSFRNSLETNLPNTVTSIPAPAPDAPKVLVLPYHERTNPVNLVDHNGGGAVVSSIYNMTLARSGKIHVIEALNERANHHTLLTVEEALAMGKELGAEYVQRGQVVEFRRAMSVPSWWSAVVSTAILAAQVLFAETSGVDIATEIYRVSDGVCVYSSRQIAHQKYVVRAEKTIRGLANLYANSTLAALKNSSLPPAKPLIDHIIVAERLEDVPLVREAPRRKDAELAEAEKTKQAQEATKEPEKQEQPSTQTPTLPEEKTPAAETAPREGEAPKDPAAKETEGSPAKEIQNLEAGDKKPDVTATAAPAKDETDKSVPPLRRHIQ